MTFAPVALFVYNRPAHTRRTLESLSANAEARETELFIYADAAKPGATGEERENVRQVRSVIRERAWCGRVTITEMETNRGLAASIIRGVREVLARSGSAIVLEDDLHLASTFLSYMNSALRCYENDQEVMHVSGYMFPVAEELPETFFLRLASSWGWATWRRAFDQFEPDAGKLLAQLRQRDLLDAFNLEGAYDFAAQLEANAAGRLRTWAVQWYATLLLKDGLGLFPRRSLVENFGFDGSGVHCQDHDKRFAGSAATGGIRVTHSKLGESEAARRAVRRFLREPLSTRWRQGLHRCWAKFRGAAEAKPTRGLSAKLHD